MVAFSCSHYYTYDEITELLQGWADEYGEVCELSSIGTSLEGRELWLLTGAWFVRVAPQCSGVGTRSLC